MDYSAMITAVILIGVLGLLLGLFLGFAAKVFHVETDEREEAILGVLPGNNCGGCGFPGCAGLASAIVKGEAPVGGCPVGGEQVAAKVAGIMGVEAAPGKRMVAYVKCGGNCEMADKKYDYHGEADCRMAAMVPGGGDKSCAYGCLGYGSCVKECEFDAIHIVKGIAVVDREACRACGKCMAACPKKLIELIPYDSEYMVACSSHDKGPDVMKSCKNGCIGCGLCMKNCEAGAISVTELLAHIDQEKCVKCGVCMEKCPRKTIVNET